MRFILSLTLDQDLFLSVTFFVPMTTQVSQAQPQTRQSLDKQRQFEDGILSSLHLFTLSSLGVEF